MEYMCEEYESMSKRLIRDLTDWDRDSAGDGGLDLVDGVTREYSRGKFSKSDGGGRGWRWCYAA